MLILASTSPYRRELLGRLGLPFECRSPGVDETALPGEAPLALAIRLARAKAQAVLTQSPDAVVIGSDQVALCEGRVLGKPGTPDKAIEQLQWQRGRVTEFHTAFAVLRGSQSVEEVVTTRVVWRSARELSDERLANYVALERPFDCAGAAKSEGLGIALLSQVESTDPTALIGLPLIRVCQALSDLGMELLPRPSAA
ncbi:MAG: Maf-like protein [Pseudomonadota bacterium]